jgi:hypothetical protein
VSQLTVRCITCGTTRTLGPLDESGRPFCKPPATCEDEFITCVQALLNGISLEDQDENPDTEFARRATAEALRILNRRVVDDYDARAREYEERRPKKLRPLYPC